MIDTCYSQEENIIYRFRKGTVHLRELLESIDLLHEEFKHLDNLNIIEDVRGSISDFTEEDYGLISLAVESYASNYKFIKCALIIDDPDNAALSILFESEAKNISNYTYKTFSTTKASKEWLMQLHLN